VASATDFGSTPKAFANFSPRLERSDNPGLKHKRSLNPEKGSANGERFQRFGLFFN
jgi:hypothetical protein